MCWREYLNKINAKVVRGIERGLESTCVGGRI